MGKRAKARTSTRAKVLATVAVIGGTAGIAGLGTFGTFTSTTTAQSATHASGTVVIDFTGTTTNRLTTGATNMAAGDTEQRGFTLHNGGSLDFSSVKATLAAPTSSLLDTDATNGLSLKIEKCAGVGWVESLTTPYTYTCAGAVSTVLADTPVATLISATGSGGTALSGLASTTSGSSDSLRATWTLPAGANNTVQGLSSTLSLGFTATQRAAQSQ